MHAPFFSASCDAVICDVKDKRDASLFVQPEVP
jgi:hypothetical protein